VNKRIRRKKDLGQRFPPVLVETFTILNEIRFQELLQERRRERDKENQRQKEALKQMETSLSAREKIFKERIVGLEGQVDVLKDQLSKEMRRRQTLIAGTYH